jgi:hypothetical protein
MARKLRYFRMQYNQVCDLSDNGSQPRKRWSPRRAYVEPKRRQHKRRRIRTTEENEHGLSVIRGEPTSDHARETIHSTVRQDRSLLMQWRSDSSRKAVLAKKTWRANELSRVSQRERREESEPRRTQTRRKSASESIQERRRSITVASKRESGDAS